MAAGELQELQAKKRGPQQERAETAHG